MQIHISIQANQNQSNKRRSLLDSLSPNILPSLPLSSEVESKPCKTLSSSAEISKKSKARGSYRGDGVLASVGDGCAAKAMAMSLAYTGKLKPVAGVANSSTPKANLRNLQQNL